MALQYPGFVAPQPTRTTLMDVFDSWNTGEAQGKAAKFEREAPDQFAKALPPLSEFGLQGSPDELRALFANPETRPLALAQVQEASQRRADSMDPVKQLALRKAQWDLTKSQRDAAAGSERKIKEDQFGVPRYLDTGEPVFPNAGEGMTPGYDPTKAFDYESGLAKEYRGGADVTAYRDVRNAYERVRNSASADNGAGDIGLIYGYMKMLDPGSVVREGEFATAEQTAGLPTTIVNTYNKLIDGSRLTPEQRKTFADAAKGLYSEAASNLKSYNAQFQPRLETWKVDPSRVIVAPEDFSDPAAPAGPANIDDLVKKYSTP